MINQIYRRFFTLSNIIFVMLLASFCDGAQAGSQKHLALVLNQDKSLHQNTADEIQQQLAHQNIVSKQFSLNSDLNALVKFTDLFVTLGQHSSQNVLDLSSNKPILALFISRQTHTQLSQHYRNQRLLSITLDQPIRRQMTETRALMPKLAVFGTVLSSDWGRYENQIRQISRELNYRDTVIRYADNEDQDKALQQINNVLEQSDVFLAFNNDLFTNRFISKKLLYLARQKRKPVVGFSPSFTSSGAIAAIFTEREQFIQDSLAFIENFLHNPQHYRNTHPYPPRSYTIKVNHSVRSHLSIDINPRREGAWQDDTLY